MALLYACVLTLIQLTMSTVLALPAEVKAADEEEYRLPQIYNISSYTLTLTVPADSLTDRTNQYTGEVTILFAVTSDTDYIALHAHKDSISLSKVTFNSVVINAVDYSVNNVTNILNINMHTPIAVGRIHTLIINFAGSLSTTDMYGFYKSSYVDKDGVTQYLATTQFEPTHAREAFPCFDEPGFKATFDVSITYPVGYNILSNTKVNSTTVVRNQATTIFETTPRMSTYLLAFIISKFTCTAGESIGEVPFQVCSRDESSSTRNWAVEVGPQLITKFNEFTDYDYVNSNSKMDQVAIPDFNAGAMENWGLITYREAALLWDDRESSNSYKQRIVTVISHELSHQWFGDLVTCAWWSDTFLNEGFARYFEYHMTHEILPNWELDKQFVIEQVHSILQADALENSLALESDCSTPSEISAKFGSISYSKGGSIIRMLAHIMGPTDFQSGLQQYLADNQLNNALPEQLWKALDDVTSKESRPLGLSYQDIMENWIHYSGFPLLTVRSVDNKTVSVTQQRFLIGDGTAYEWSIPITYTTSADDRKFENTLPSHWLFPSGSLTITLPDNANWIILNNQQTGYYRVNYDDTLWDAIGTALSSANFGGITELNRAQIVDDLFNLAKASRIPYPRIFKLTNFLVNDVSYYSWYPALDEYKYLLNRVGENTPLGKAIGSSILTLMDAFYKSVPISKLNADNQIYTLSQVLALTWACKLGHESCVDDSLKLFNDYKVKNIRPDKNLRAIVYCNGLRYSNNDSDWEFLWNAYGTSAGLSTEQVTILQALGCTKNVILLKEYLKKTITDGSGIRPQDASSVFSSVYNGNSEGIAVAFDFLTENYKVIPDKYQGDVLPSLIKGVAGLFTTNQETTKLKKFITNNTLPEDFRTAAEDAVKTSEYNVNWVAKFEKELLNYYDINAVGKINGSLMVLLLALVINKFL